MAAFAPPPPDSAYARSSPHQHLEGRLRLGALRIAHGFHPILDRYGDANTHDRAAQHLPDFDFEFVQDGDALIPVQRGAIPSTHPEWEFILEPGRVWDEPGDGGYTRASLPFALEERNANCMHQGVLTFLFRADGAVSDAAYEIAGETCAYFRFDAWGYVQARYMPGAIAGRKTVIGHYRDEVRARLPQRPLAQLAADVHGARPEAFGAAAEIPPETMSVYGLVVDGVHYRSDCATRQGPYPYCEVMDLPSYSLAKSVGAGIAVMRLAADYPQLTSTRIAALVPQCAGRGGWGDVTIGDALDMATGRYDSAAYEADEDSAATLEGFFLPDRHAAKLDFACRHYPRKAAPGSVWVYHSTDTYVLGAALNAFLRARTGPDADFYRDILADRLWPALQLGSQLGVSRRTYDAAAQPFTGYGLTLHGDDIARLSLFLNVDHGRIGTMQVLDPVLLDQALQRDGAHPGLRAGFDELRYKNGFWAWNAQQALGCRTATWIPFMSGYGGIVVALLPNGMTYYYFSDGAVFSWKMAAVEADRIRPFCQR
jgi:hypothetical protein